MLLPSALRWLVALCCTAGFGACTASLGHAAKSEPSGSCWASARLPLVAPVSVVLVVVVATTAAAVVLMPAVVVVVVVLMMALVVFVVVIVEVVVVVVIIVCIGHVLEPRGGYGRARVLRPGCQGSCACIEEPYCSKQFAEMLGVAQRGASRSIFRGVFFELAALDTGSTRLRLCRGAHSSRVGHCHTRCGHCC